MINESSTYTRRTFVLVAAVAASSLHTIMAFAAKPVRKLSGDWLDRWLDGASHPGAIERVGRHISQVLQCHPHAHIPAEAIGAFERYQSDEDVLDLRARIASEHRSGQTIVVDGILLSVSECALYLAAAHRSGILRLG
jgi:hypothetical protein